ncbi:phosphoprotein phosphatase [Mycena metata]|uniref:Serine/threonine-protein phosphatase n=1 Tax=Mycena metata TaxID=1033252 RepID=A0AAD7IRH9_9AGAR|nr:phosphoprotein phosphatase [Mycena metata]
MFLTPYIALATPSAVTTDQKVKGSLLPCKLFSGFKAPLYFTAFRASHQRRAIETVGKRLWSKFLSSSIQRASTMSDASSAPTSPALSASTPPSSVPSPQLQALSIEVSADDKAAAAALKAEANKAFSSHDFPAAARLYSEAIEKNPADPTIWCNRAYARMKLEEFGYALSDCTQAIQLDGKYAKAYYRRATCQMQILKPQAAVADFRKVLAIEPKNETVRAQLVATQKLIRKIEFEKAIEVEGEQSAVVRCQEIIAEGGCDVEKTYTGPTLPFADGKYSITHEFVTAMIQWFKDGKALPKRYVWEIVLGAHEHFSKEESLVKVDLEDGVTCDVIGDVHGQFYDMLHLYSLTGEPSEKHYLLMNGDLVDRGSWSIEVILTAFAFKCELLFCPLWLYPRFMYINRGNHEAKDMNRSYGFEGEAKHKHGEQTYKARFLPRLLALVLNRSSQLFAHVFTTLPLSTLISATKPPPNKTGSPILSPQGLKRYFVVHGGLFSKDGVTLEDIRKIPRIGRQPGQEGLMCELLWTDPQTMPGRGPSKRGVGIAFGPDVTRKWCTLNGVTGIIRSHEVRQDGYQVEHDGLCTTVFSAPNYVDQGGNKGAFIRIDSEGTQKYTQFEAMPHPNIKPMAYLQGGLGSMMM